MGRIFLKGFTTGMILQLAIGPVFMFVVNMALQNGLISGLSAVVGVTVGDFIYIIMAIIGIGKLLEKDGIKRIFIVISSVVLMIFGLMMIKNGIDFVINKGADLAVNGGIVQSFVTAFVLTVASPLTIVFWTGIFAAKTIEYSLNKKELVVFGLAAGFSTVIFLGICVTVLAFVKTMIPDLLVQVLNIVVGVLLILYGVSRIVKGLKKE